MSGAFEKCATVAAKEEMDEEMNGEEEEPVKAIPKGTVVFFIFFIFVFHLK